MRVQPVKRYRRPRFPTGEFVAAHPELLRLVPKRWRNNRAVLVILAAVLLISLKSRAGQAQSAGSPRVAPVFAHGAGQGRFGGLFDTAVSLSEEEARQIIDGEAAKHNLLFKSGFKLDGVNLPLVAEAYIGRQEDKSIASTRLGVLEFDGYDQRKKVAYEYVSLGDYDTWRKEPNASTVWKYSTGEAAFALYKCLLGTKSAASIGIFYDPLTRDGNTSRQELLRQVRDFFAWLKTQGVI